VFLNVKTTVTASDNHWREQRQKWGKGRTEKKKKWQILMGTMARQLSKNHIRITPGDSTRRK